MGRKAGLTDEKLRAVLGNDLSVFSDTERLVIELADAMVTAPSNISDDLYARLTKHFSEEQLMQLSARWNRVFDVESDHIYRSDTWLQTPISLPCARHL